ncbi:MAG: glycosyltransferase, partial [Cellvibrionales bacterium]|nr:glycosyltransferase [Cellvibrionales bacterium]
MLHPLSSTPNTEDPINIAVVLVTFNRSAMLAKNLASLKQQGPLTYFVIDNNSSDNTQLVVEAFAASTTDTVIYYNTGANLGGAGGFAVGCEKALAYSSAFTHLWLTDDDVTFDIHCLQTLKPLLDQKTIWQPMRFTPEGKNAEASTTIIDLKTPWILNHKRNSIMTMQEAHAT